MINELSNVIIVRYKNAKRSTKIGTTTRTLGVLRTLQGPPQKFGGTSAMVHPKSRPKACQNMHFPAPIQFTV